MIVNVVVQTSHLRFVLLKYKGYSDRDKCNKQAGFAVLHSSLTIGLVGLGLGWVGVGLGWG